MNTEIRKMQLKLEITKERKRSDTYFGSGSDFSFVNRDVVSADDDETCCGCHLLLFYQLCLPLPTTLSHRDDERSSSFGLFYVSFLLNLIWGTFPKIYLPQLYFTLCRILPPTGFFSCTILLCR